MPKDDTFKIFPNIWKIPSSGEECIVDCYRLLEELQDCIAAIPSNISTYKHIPVHCSWKNSVKYIQMPLLYWE